MAGLAEWYSVASPLWGVSKEFNAFRRAGGADVPLFGMSATHWRGAYNPTKGVGTYTPPAVSFSGLAAYRIQD
jgi:hypothetical protein